jgi:hypothetical protein
MYIEANNTKDFEKQYYEIFNGKSQHETSINLKTNANFWEELTEMPLKNTVNSLKFYNSELLKCNISAKDFKTVFHPKYGNITFVNKDEQGIISL